MEKFIKIKNPKRLSGFQFVYTSFKNKTHRPCCPESKYRYRLQSK